METKYQKLFPTLIMQAESILTNHQLNQINVDITKIKHNQYMVLFRVNQIYINKKYTNLYAERF